MERFADELDLAQHSAQQSIDATIQRIVECFRADAGCANCIDCGETIPEARRAALPHATRCAPCQEQRESR